MKKDILFKLIVKLSLLCFATFLSYKLSYFIGERYFFDKLFYQKSIKHGYWIPVKKLVLSDFGDRAKDVLDLYNHERNGNNNVLGTDTDDIFNIAVIGDSFVWGQGLKNEDRFVILLNKKLNTLRKTQVFSFAQGGDNIFDNFAKYQSIKSAYFIDVFIFFLVGNDLLIKNPRYKHDVTKTVSEYCHALTGGDQIFDFFVTRSGPEAFYNPASLCALDVMSRVYPRENSIYFYNMIYPGFDLYIDAFQRTGHFMLSIEKARYMKEYQKYWTETARNKYDWMRVSQSETHPSAVSNRMFTDVLFDEIVFNPVWGFSKK